MRTAVGFGVAVVGVVWWASQQQAPRLPHSPERLLLLGLALVVYVVAILARCHRWDVILRVAGVGHRRGDAYALTTVGYMGNTVLPARGGELLRILLLSERSTAGRRETLGSVVCERILDVTALIGLLCLVTVVGVAGTPAGTAPAVLAATGLLGGAPLLVVYLKLRARGRLERFAAYVRPVAHASRLLITWRGAALALLSALAWSMDAVVFWLIAQSLSTSVGVIEAVLVVVLASFFSFIPAAPGYVGTYDAGILFTLGAIGISGATALSQTLLFRFIMFVPITFFGLAIVVFRYGGIGALRRGGAPARAETT